MAVPQPNWLERLLFGQEVWQWSDFAHQLTGYKYVLASGRDPRNWPTAWHQGTGWKNYVQPDAEKVSVYKTKWKTIETVKFRWPEEFRNVSAGMSDPSKANMYGQGSGIPLQMGSDQMRSLTYGYAEWGQQKKAKIPKPVSGKYWIEGDPSPAYDKHCCIVAPSGDVFEMIQFDPNQPENAFMNQALNMAHYSEGELVDGTPVCAGQVSMTSFMFDSRSAVNKHTLGLVLFDYYGHDGLLPISKPGVDIPKIRDQFALDPDSESARKMLSMGGDCSAVAQCLIEYGCIVLDRSGYSDVKNNATEIGKKPHPSGFLVQAGSRGNSNIGYFNIKLSDLNLVASYRSE